MRLTPLDIQNHRFSRRLRGLDPAEVESFLQLLAEDYEALRKERDALDAHTRRQEARIQELSMNEKMLQDTLVTAQTISEDLKKTAMKEAEVTLGQAEVKAEKMLRASHRRAAQLAGEIQELKAVRLRLGVTLRQTLESHLQLVESLTAIDEADPEDDKIAYLADRSQETGS